MILKKKQVLILIVVLLIILNSSTIQAENFLSFLQKNKCQETTKQTNNYLKILEPKNTSCKTFSKNYTALILNPSEYIYGKQHCLKITSKLINKGYNVVYLSNECVDLNFIKNNLSAEIVYINTHAGYFDLDNDNISESVVVATGEHWTNETTIKYQFEYENKMIVEGRVGNNSFVAFTPNLINYYYNPGDLPNSLVYMATCYATYDDSMAQVFLDKGASAYIGWNKNTFFWTNSITSVLAFRLFINGFSVKQVCKLIGFGGFMNFLLLQSKLTYYGDGNHRI